MPIPNNINLSVRRLLAFLFDIVLVCMLFSIIQYFISLHLALFSDINTLSISNIIFALTCLYFIIGDSQIMNNATYGKRVFKLHVVTSNSTYLSLIQTSVRTIILFLFPWFATNIIANLAPNKGMSYEFLTKSLSLWLTAHFALFLIPPLSVLLGNGTEGIHDRVSNARVVRNGSDHVDHKRARKPGVLANTIFVSIIISIIAGALLNVLWILWLSPTDGKTPFSNIILDGESEIRNIYGSVPEKYIVHGFTEEGEVFTAKIRGSLPTREKIGKYLELPFYAIDSIYEFRVTKGLTKKDIVLFRIYEQENNKEYVVREDTPFIKAELYLTNRSLGFREIYAKLINNTVDRVLRPTKDQEIIPLIIIRLIHKETVGWISIEFTDEIYYISQQGAFRRVDAKPRAITLYIPFMPPVERPLQLIY